MKRSRRTYLIGGALLAVLALTASGLLLYELRTSRLQARYLSRLARELHFQVEPGPSPAIRFPAGGPYDQRLGYRDLPTFIERLTAKGFVVEAQARSSPRLLELTDRGLFPIYREKTRAGLHILDRDDRPLFSASYPERFYQRFEHIPEVIVQTLLFIENRELLDGRIPRQNPAVEWDRLANAVLHAGIQMVDRKHKVPGGSTLATQIEKFRHSPEGRTASAPEKVRQIASASLRAYLDGERTRDTRRRIVCDYINSMPLAGIPGYGEVTSLGDGLWAWYEADFEQVNHILTRRLTAPNNPDRAAWGLAYKQVLSLILAQRRPSYYLSDPRALDTLTQKYLVLLGRSGLISSWEQDAAQRARLHLRREAPERPETPFLERKAINAIRTRLIPLLELSQLYDLDRLDLKVKSTLDRRTEEEVTRILRQLGDPAYAQAAGLTGFRLLERGDPARVIYSFTLYECGPDATLLRVQTDNFNQPLNINEGIKLELGSSAKLRTLVTYLEIVAALHQRYAGQPAEELRALSFPVQDALSRWAVHYLAGAADTTLPALLEASLGRSFSANPEEEFFTGGGLHTFANYNEEDDDQVFTVREAFRHSVNLVFIRMMREIARHYLYQRPDIAELLADREDPRRQAYLERFADREGRSFIGRFYRRYQDKAPQEALDLLLERLHPTPARLAAIFRFVVPEAGSQEFAAFLRLQLPGSTLTDKTLDRLYQDYAPASYSLTDRAYIARVHPLELWLVAHLRSHPQASLSEAIEASAQERQAVYTWLFKTYHKNRQDRRILILLEDEAFQEIHRGWKRLGYPFDYLVPSYATAIGSSGDRPASLAELVGILLNGGVRYPAARIQELHFAESTPYETLLRRPAGNGEQVLHPEIARVVRQELVGVVESGTARRVHRAFQKADGQPIEVGGKTGTGDNRREIYGAGGRLIEAHVYSRTATFVFLLGDRFFGVITAFVTGPEAANYRFTSALPVQVLKVLAPQLMPLIEQAGQSTPPPG